MQKRKKIGLALGSGGARGFSHIGVLETLEKYNIPIDMIAGCSIGAIAGAIYSVGTDLHLLSRYVSTLDKKAIMDLTMPTQGGILQGNKIEEIIRVLTHDKTFAQTKIPFFCTATDMESGTLTVFSEGKLHRAVRASMCVPGVFVPVEMNGHYYCDGGILESVPATVLRQQGMDVVIGVDLSQKRNRISEGKLGAYSTLLRMFDIMQHEIDTLRPPDVDVLVKPSAAFMSLLSSEGTEECVDEGRRATEAVIPQILDAIGGNSELASNCTL
ncbi:MAG: patatin-like phospholipase family protein [Eubacteriales bacterium]|nr:patatin-like phospholipase family protein [Eubacteriales bacterium]